MQKLKEKAQNRCVTLRTSALWLPKASKSAGKNDGN